MGARGTIDDVDDVVDVVDIDAGGAVGTVVVDIDMGTEYLFT